MRSKLPVLVAGLLLLGFAAPAPQAQGAMSVGVSVVTGGPHRGLSLSFSSHPNFGLIPGSRVYYGRDIDRDVYCYGDEWYYVDQDAWYRGPSYEGPFVAISFSSVPYEIRSVPDRYRRHWSDRWSSSPRVYGGYGGGYGTGYGYDNRSAYSDWNSTWNRNHQRYRGKWNDRRTSNGRDGSQGWGSYQDRQNQNDRQDQNQSGHGRGRGHGHSDNRGQGRGDWGG